MECVIDVYKNRAIAAVAIPGAYLQAKQSKEDKDVHVILDGRMAELLTKISPEKYQEYVHEKEGRHTSITS